MQCVSIVSCKACIGGAAQKYTVTQPLSISLALPVQAVWKAALSRQSTSTFAVRHSTFLSNNVQQEANSSCPLWLESDRNVRSERAIGSKFVPIKAEQEGEEIWHGRCHLFELAPNGSTQACIHLLESRSTFPELLYCC